VGRIVPDPDGDAKPLQAKGVFRRFQVGTAHLIAKIVEDLGDPAHPDPTDPDEMNALDLLEHPLTLNGSW
jgi:hypothetical protein